MNDERKSASGTGENVPVSEHSSGDDRSDGAICGDEEQLARHVFFTCVPPRTFRRV
jgi:hypothetical protein